jgi:hypothetical protein
MRYLEILTIASLQESSGSGGDSHDASTDLGRGTSERGRRGSGAANGVGAGTAGGRNNHGRVAASRVDRGGSRGHAGGVNRSQSRGLGNDRSRDGVGDRARAVGDCESSRLSDGVGHAAIGDRSGRGADGSELRHNRGGVHDRGRDGVGSAGGGRGIHGGDSVGSAGRSGGIDGGDLGRRGSVLSRVAVAVLRRGRDASNNGGGGGNGETHFEGLVFWFTWVLGT